MRPELDLERLFTYHAPHGDQLERYGKLRQSAKAFAEQIMLWCPDGPDKSAAIRKVREAVMTANAAIACGEE